ncbi:hypothetical protein XELAEV_18042883mg [Xenopus laevis]|uniref:Uncharacterized protein n=1 Tax=Xenopus laevis TaxID=8355 RepID=A0A974C4P1_XENLA|nr:hypothetical protein XELAEV_18042883mg [Xenopus laevis]
MGTELPNPHRSLLHGHRVPQPSQVSPSWAQSSSILTGLSFMGTDLPNPHRSLLHGHRTPQPSQVSPSWAQSSPALTGLSFMGTEFLNPHRSLLHGHRSPQPSQVSPSWAQISPTLTGLSFMGTDLPNPQIPPKLLKPHMSSLNGNRTTQDSRMNNADVFVTGGEAGVFMARVPKQRCLSALDPRIPSEEDLHSEELDGFIAVPLRRSCRLRSSLHSMDAFRRHSWEPGKRLQEMEADYEELSQSLKGLDAEEIEGNMGNRRDPRRTPIISSTDELESWLSTRGEDLEVTQEEHAKRLQAYLSSQHYLYNPLSKSVSMSGIDRTFCYPDDVTFYSQGRNLSNG